MFAPNTENIREELKRALEFYEALGFERLPLPSMAGREDSIRRNKKSELELLREEIGDCRRCKLSHKRTHIVFGEGNADARLMFIGEAPGREEDIQARPFVGDAGLLLTRLIEKMGLRREEVYIANIVKCRPPMNRDPEKDEIEACRGFLERQIDTIRPDIIMTLGRIAASVLTGIENLKITAIRGKTFDFRGIPLVPTFHPAYLIRNPRDKWLTWNDARKVLAFLERGCLLPEEDL